MASVEGGFVGVGVLGLGSDADSDSSAMDEGKETGNWKWRSIEGF